MLTKAEENIIEEVDRLKSKIIELTKDLIRIPTENPPGRNYRKCAELLADMLEKLDYEVELVEVPASLAEKLAPHGESLPRVNVVAQLRGSERALHLNGHFDVVPAGSGWSKPPFGAIEEDGRIYGRGASDMKAGIAAQIYAIEAIRGSGAALKGTIIQTLTVDEETGGFAGLGYLIENYFKKRKFGDYCIIADVSSVGRVCIGHRGVIWWELITRGIKSHGAQPHLGENAVEKMLYILTRVLNRLKPKVESRRSTWPILPEECRTPSISVNMISGGYARNIIPDLCIASLDRRVIPEEDLSDVRREFMEALESAKREAGVDCEVVEVMSVPPLHTSPDSKLARVICSKIRSLTGMKPELFLLPATCDMKFVLSKLNLSECVVYGPGLPALAHTTDEYVSIQDLILYTKVLATSIANILEVIPV